MFRFDNKVLSLHQTLNFIDMQVISTREFRANQKKYFDLAANETIYVARRNEAPILISVAKDEDMLNKRGASFNSEGVRRRSKWSC